MLADGASEILRIVPSGMSKLLMVIEMSCAVDEVDRLKKSKPDEELN